MVGRLYEGRFSIDVRTHESNLTRMYVDSATEFIARNAAARRPFFLLFAPDASHTRVYASRPFLGRSRRGPYGDALAELDRGVGEILRRLRRSGVEEETFVFFTSDNGAATWSQTMGGVNGPFLCGKQTTFEGGVRLPGIAWGAGVGGGGGGGGGGGKGGGGRTTRQVTSLMDLFPTILAMAGVEAPKGLKLDGVDLTAVISGAEKNAFEFDRPIFHYRGNELFAVRTGLYKAHLWTWTNGEFTAPVELVRLCLTRARLF